MKTKHVSIQRERERKLLITNKYVYFGVNCKRNERREWWTVGQLGRGKKMCCENFKMVLTKKIMIYERMHLRGSGSDVNAHSVSWLSLYVAWCAIWKGARRWTPHEELTSSLSKRQRSSLKRTHLFCGFDLHFVHNVYVYVAITK